MKFETGPVDGARIISLEERVDERGFFARSYAIDEFDPEGIDGTIVQQNLSFNHKKGTLRGMHWQAAPYQEAKTIRCTRGRVYDVIVDIRPDSPTYLKWVGVELSADNRLAMFAPKGTAHGYLTLVDESEVVYNVTTPFTPSADSGARWNDPSFAVEWPFEPTIVSEKDANFPDFPA